MATGDVSGAPKEEETPPPPPQKLRSLDLFTGVGGLTLALRGFADPALYCEIDRECHKIMKALFGKNMLPDRPINSDVRQLSGDSIPDVDLIVAGFPCFPAGTLVVTDAGYVPIESVTTERLLTHTGAMCDIVELQRKVYAGRMHTVEVHGHLPIRVTPEHPFYARTDAVPQPAWVDARDLGPDHYVGFPIDGAATVPEFTVSCGVGVHAVTTARVALDDPDQWWTMGYFLGAGWLTAAAGRHGHGHEHEHEHGRPLQHEHRIMFAIAHEAEAEVLPRLRRVLHVTPAGTARRRGSGKYVARDEMWHVVLSSFGRGAHGKFVPEWVQSAPADLACAFADGYFAAADVTVSRAAVPKWSVTSASRALALGMQRLLAKLGLVFAVTTAACDQQRRAPYVLSGRIEKTRTTRTEGSSFIDGGYLWSRVESNTSSAPSGDKPQLVYNFHVADDNSYVVENVAVHNCIGFSPTGLRRGFDNAQSGLFMEVCRLVREIRPKFLFCENVPGITALGLEPVVEMCKQEGYDMWWLVLPAYAVPTPDGCTASSDVFPPGAPQSRHRWFALVVRRDVQEHVLHLGDMRDCGGVWLTQAQETYAPYPWHLGEPCPRMVPGAGVHKGKHKKRLSVMGNTVVPDCARTAFVMLWLGLNVHPAQALAMKTLRLTRPTPGKPLPPRGGGRRCGSYVDGILRRCCMPPGTIPPKPNLKLTFPPGAFTSESKAHKAAPGNLLVEPHKLSLWATPRAGCTGASLVLTRRTIRDLPSLIRFEAGTPDEDRAGIPNPCFFEYIMGFPPGWTEY